MIAGLFHNVFVIFFVIAGECGIFRKAIFCHDEIAVGVGFLLVAVHIFHKKVYGEVAIGVGGLFRKLLPFFVDAVANGIPVPFVVEVCELLLFLGS